ncbi:MAG: hypothetical protein IJT82_04975 [Schwartzia sp.]|nr:hypothetical protein [Schwartzia sp. (in: firmicutes)]
MNRSRCMTCLAIFVLMMTLAFAPGQASAKEAVPLEKAESEKTSWVWINSDQKYGKFYSPSTVIVTAQANGVATCIAAWTKTVYTFGGAEETINNYGISKIIPDPRELSSSLALVNIRPQTREIEYIRENFYDAKGKVIWSKIYEEPRTVKEINSQSFDEDFYVAIVDSVFRHGERDRQQADDRWKQLWTAKTETGATVTALADTTTMRLAADNLIYWEWVETKDSAGNVVEVRFMKKSLNSSQGTEKVIKGTAWNSATGWQEMLPDGLYTAIRAGTPQAHGLNRLREIIKGYQYWLNRYRTDTPAAGRKKK